MAVEYQTGNWLKMAEAKQKHTIIESMLVQELHFAIVLAVRKGSLITVSHCVPMEIWQSRVALPPGCTFFLQSKLQDWASSCMYSKLGFDIQEQALFVGVTMPNPRSPR